MIDVKKLTIGFLVLALAGASSAWIFSSVGGSSTTNLAAAADAGTTDATGAAATDPTLSGNAFAAQTQDQDQVALGVTSDYADTDIPSSTQAELNDPNNLTATLANSYLNGLMQTNPDGPQTDASGNLTLTPADGNGVMSAVDASNAINDVTIPDWDSEASEIPVVKAAGPSSTADAAYSKAVLDIFNQHFVETGLQNMLSQNSDPSAADYTKTQVQGALQDAAGLKTPANAVAFQQSLIKLLVYQKNMLALLDTVNNDPLKTAVIFQAEETKYTAALGDFQNQLQQTQGLNGLSFVSTPQTKKAPPVAFLDKIFGVPTANAQFAFIDFDPTIFSQMILTYLNNIILQILKNTIIYLMQKEVLAWIHGNGVPKIIQNWGTTLVNSYTMTAVNSLNSQMQCLNGSPFASQVRLTLGAYYQPNTNVCAVQFQSALAGNNLTNFLNKFSNGGFVTFGQSLQPSNNYYGQVFFTAQVVGNTAQNSQTATLGKTTAASGYKGAETCADHSDPNNGQHMACVFATGDSIDLPPPGTPCPGSSFPAYVANNGTCSNGADPIINSPGAVTGQVFNTSIDASPKLITAANDIAGILDALLSSVLNSLASDAVTAAQGALQQVVNGTSVGGTTVTGGTPVTQAIQCTPPPGTLTLVGGTVTAQFSVSGGTLVSTGGTPVAYTWSAPGGNPTTNPPTGGTGNTFSTTYTATSTFNVTVTDNLDNTTANCTVTVN